MSRTNNSLKNIRYAALFKLAVVLVNFISRRVFVTILSDAYLGLNGTFANILSMLSLAELGVGTAITYSMYKPLAEQDEDQLLGLMALYRRFYWIIGIVIAVIGAGLTPFLPKLIHDHAALNVPHIQLIYLLFVFDSALSYFFVYKQSIITADQKQYIVTFYQNIILILSVVAQIIFLLLTKNYFVFLGIKIAGTLLTNLLLARKANKLYPYLTQRRKVGLPAETRTTISKNIRATLMHKIGAVVVFETDNFLIMYFIGAIAVGFYSNYLMITQGLMNVFTMVFRSMTASVGNLCAEEDKSHAREVFWKLDFFTRWLYGFSAVCLMVLLNHFIGSVWLHQEKYLFSLSIVLLICLNFYLTGMRQGVLTFRDAMGLYWYDRHKPIAESLINLGVSIALAKPLGIAGIFIGTFVSSITTCCWIEPYILFKHGFRSSSKPYFLKYAIHTLVTAVIGYATWSLCALLPSSGFMPFIGKLFICAVVPNLGYFLVYGRTEEFRYAMELLRSRVNRILKKEA